MLFGSAVNTTCNNGFLEITNICNNRFLLPYNAPEINLLSISPNPSTNYIDIVFEILNTTNNATATIELYNLAGTIIEKRIINATTKGEQKEKFDLTELASGMYYGNIRYFCGRE